MNLDKTRIISVVGNEFSEMTDLQRALLHTKSDNITVDDSKTADTGDSYEAFRVDCLSPNQLIRFDSAVLGLVEYIMSQQIAKSST